MADFDKRLTLVEHDVKQVLEALPTLHVKLDAIRSDMAEPQSSPLGRALLERAIKNAGSIEALNVEMDEVQKWQHNVDGAAKVTRYIQIILGIAIAVITLAQFASRTSP